MAVVEGFMSMCLDLSNNSCSSAPQQLEPVAVTLINTRAKHITVVITLHSTVHPALFHANIKAETSCSKKKVSKNVPKTTILQKHGKNKECKTITRDLPVHGRAIAITASVAAVGSLFAGCYK